MGEEMCGLVGYSQEHGAADGARKGLFIHPGQIRVPVKVAGTGKHKFKFIRGKVILYYIQSG